jgi:hypothetical protein
MEEKSTILGALSNARRLSTRHFSPAEFLKGRRYGTEPSTVPGTRSSLPQPLRFPASAKLQ